MSGLSEEQVTDINHKVDWEGLDGYLDSHAAIDLEGTELEPLLRAYDEARTELLARMRGIGIDV